MAFGAAGLDFFGRDPCLSPADQAHGFWCRRFRNIWTSTEKARRRVYCTGLRASWSELAYGRPLLVCFRNRAPLAVRGLGGCNM